MNITEIVKKVLNSNIEYSESRIVWYRKILPLVVQIAEKLEEIELEGDFYGSTFSFDPPDSEGAFTITAKLLEAFPEIEKFEKVFDGGRYDPAWKWVGGITRDEISAQFTISKATPDEDCVPRQEIYTSKSWVCGRRS